MRYKRPTIETAESEFVLLCGSVPGATDIREPSFDSKSVWDDDIETHYNNIMEENNYEGKVYE